MSAAEPTSVMTLLPEPSPLFRLSVTPAPIAAPSAGVAKVPVEAETILTPLGLSDQPELLNVTARQIDQIFERIMFEYGKDDLHIRLADGFARGAFGHAFLALQCSQNLREGVHRVARFKEILEPVAWIIDESDTRFSIQIKPATEEFSFSGVWQICCFLWLVKSCRNVTAKNLMPLRVQITTAVPEQAAIEQEIGCVIEVADRAVLELPQEAMEYRVLSSNPYVTSGLDSGALRTRRNRTAGDSLAAAVFSLVLELLPSGVVSLDRVAQRMALGKRTLERRLSEEGYSFSEIVRDCRQDMAIHYLSNTPLPLTEVGLLLGYREVNSFYRAFKEWVGCTPQEYRTQSR